MRKRMHRNTSPFSPYLALMAAVCLGVAGVAAPRPVIAQALLVACVLLAAVSLVMNLNLGGNPWDRRRRR
jgi:uncharacterized membrane protein YtjA (UPF0391 family)